jgi:hypothetical protein
MDYWIVKQLRAAILSDLWEFVPAEYFDGEKEQFKLDERINGAAHISFEMRWGYLAGTLGRRLYFESSSPMSARQVSASEMLMHLGLLAAAEASMEACTKLSDEAKTKDIPDGNSGAVAEQLRVEQIPQLKSNLVQGLKQYLRHLTPAEGEPFKPLLDSIPIPSVF